MYILSYILFLIEIGLQAYFSIGILIVCMTFNSSGWYIPVLFLINLLVLCILRVILRKKMKQLGIVTIIDLGLALCGMVILIILDSLPPSMILPFTGVFGVASSIILFFVPKNMEEVKEMKTLEDYLEFIKGLRKLKLYNQISGYDYQSKMYYAYSGILECKKGIVEDLNQSKENLKNGVIDVDTFAEKIQLDMKEIQGIDDALESIKNHLAFKKIYS